MPVDSLRFPEERRLATVLFADVQGFTALAEKLDFETVSDLLKGIWEQLDKAIENHNGYIDKHMGDGVMAIWGAPFAGENDAQQAVATGLDLIRALNDFCENSHISGAKTLKLRVGVNTGAVFAGYVGTRREYTVFGDTVNVASRLEQIAQAGTVVIGENTLRMVRNSFRVKRLEPTMAKGKTELVQPFEVEGMLSLTERVRSQNAGNLLTNMVGRNNEMQKLWKMYEQSFEGSKPSMALINGDVGIGKTRLVMDFGNLLESKGEKVSILSTHGLSQTSHNPFSVWRVLIRSRFGIRDDDSQHEGLNKWKHGLNSVWTEDGQGQKAEAAYVLGKMIGISDTGEGQQTIKAENREELLAHIISLSRELLRRISLKRRLVLFIDDLQWADRESLLLLANLLTSEEATFNTMIVGAARLEFLKKNSQWHNLARVIHLHPLEITPALINQAYPDLHFLPQDILEDVAQHADGNPYFLGEIINNLVKGGLFAQQSGMDALEIRNHLSTQIPETLRATMQARMDNLSREARTVALLASVVGRVFWVGAVLAAARSTPLPGSTPILNIPEAVVDRFTQDGLRQLVRADLAFPREGTKYSNEQEYYFKNSYLRDVAYELIPNRNRAQYHKAVATWALEYSTHIQDPAQRFTFESTARDHEDKATFCAKITTGTLTPTSVET